MAKSNKKGTTYNAKWWSNMDVWMKVLREHPAPIHGLGNTRCQKAEWVVNIYSNSILWRKLSGEKWISTLILKERRNMAWQQEGAREFPLGPPVLRTTDPKSSTVPVYSSRPSTHYQAHGFLWFEWQTGQTIAHLGIQTVTYFSKMQPSDHSQSSCKALEQEPHDGGQQKNPEQLEKNKIPS